VKRARTGAIGLGATVNVLCAVLWGSGALDSGEAGRVAATTTVLLVMASLAQWCRHAGLPRSEFDTSLQDDGRPPVARPPDLVRMERLLDTKLTAGDVQFRLRPLLADIARYRLAIGRGVDLDRDDAAAKASLGERLYDIVRPARPIPTERWEPAGLGADELADLIASLEAL
jgi:hypothetical protein